ncbi:thioredoxin-disulfide reductase [Brucepastera parasyntrophica]|uniref:thioredoxin-disulfide reductase n=1 Tax=Brucepastera parasyntrophica TaxID=2880008 RepID=UPI00210E527A|nr:thioredoxin-disulfide reductase [Brucepastera parasyntrophica]ULQ59192.1 thioredoxin-disulfide reductase [Brucepastera parasyntrophica]
MDEIYDLIIIGAGTAGLVTAQYACRSNLNALVIEEKMEGGQATLIPLLENYPGFPEPIDGFTFAEKMKLQAVQFGSKFLSGKVTGLGKKKHLFSVSVEKSDDSIQTLEAKTVVLATGAAHRQLGIPGEFEFYGKGVSYCANCDGPLFRNKHIVIIGGGDAACDEAGFLAHLTDRVTIIHRKHTFRAQRALAERTLKNPHIHVRFNSVVTAINGSKNENGHEKLTSITVENVHTGAAEEVACDAVFISIGMDPRTELAALARKDEAGYLITDENMQTSIPGLFAAGDLRAKPFRQLVTAAADGAIAARSAAEYIDIHIRGT